MKDLYIIGAGGFGKETAALVERINVGETMWNLKGFLDDDPDKHGGNLFDYPILGGMDYLDSLSKDVFVICAIGTAKIRKMLIERIAAKSNVRFATLVDPSVSQTRNVSIGEGSIVWIGSILSVDSQIGNHVIINLDCTIGHDAVLEDFVTVYPGANISGNCTIGQTVEIGTGSQIIQGCSIKEGSILGAGSVVVRDIKEAGTYVGVPAKRIK